MPRTRLTATGALGRRARRSGMDWGRRQRRLSGQCQSCPRPALIVMLYDPDLDAIVQCHSQIYCVAHRAEYRTPPRRNWEKRLRDLPVETTDGNPDGSG